jgi:precorrin-3B C17-methyltransferase
VSGSIVVVGIGPGDTAHLTPAARHAVETADVIVGYVTYLRLIKSLAPDVPRESSGMRKEVERVTRAVDHAVQGRRVAVVSGGDAGIYGMAGLVYEVLRERGLTGIAVDVVPGITALSAAAALLGAPLMTDFAVISLSDQLVPREDILKRVELAAQADFVIGLYNPKGKQRGEAFDRACEIISRHRAPDTPVGVVRAAARDGQQVTVTTLAQLSRVEVDMLTIIVVGNSRTFLHGGKMITPRGYGDKYELGG